MSTDTHTALSLLSSQTASATSGLGLKTAAARPALPEAAGAGGSGPTVATPRGPAQPSEREGKRLPPGATWAHRAPWDACLQLVLSQRLQEGWLPSPLTSLSARAQAPGTRRSSTACATDGLPVTSGVWDTHCCVRRLSNFVISSFPFAKILRPVISQQPA